jgi:ribosomal protein S18 acetylase RimI-like enzyme
VQSEISIGEIDGNAFAAHLDDLTTILHAAVNAGASVGFILPYTLEDSRSFWLGNIHPSVEDGKRILLIARIDDRTAGTVQLDIDVLPNQAHRGEVSKLLVHPDFRGRGVARLLMARLEGCAQELGKTLLTLDTRTGDTAEPLYRSLGYQTAGVIPGYCRAPDADRYDSTTYMYKAL